MVTPNQTGGYTTLKLSADGRKLYDPAGGGQQ